MKGKEKNSTVGKKFSLSLNSTSWNRSIFFRSVCGPHLLIRCCLIKLKATAQGWMVSVCSHSCLWGNAKSTTSYSFELAREVSPDYNSTWKFLFWSYERVMLLHELMMAIFNTQVLWSHCILCTSCRCRFLLSCCYCWHTRCANTVINDRAI